MLINHAALEQSFHNDESPQENGQQVRESILLSTAEETFKKCLDLIRRKNHDYSTGDDEFRNLRLITHVRPNISIVDGVMVRLCDKIARIGNLLDFPPEVKDESINDSIDDAINYLIFIKSLRKAKKTEKE